MTEHKEASSPFVKYLSRPEVFSQLQKNIQRYLNDEHSSITNASRYFNDLPGEYAQFKLLLNTLPEAYKNDELGLWFDFASLIGMTDLFNNDVVVHRDIYALLNTKDPERKAGPWEMLLQHYDEAKIKAYVFSSYLLLLCESAAKLLNSKLKISDDCDMTNRPDIIFFKVVNERCNQLDKLDADSVNSFRVTVTKMLFDETVKSKNLQREICKYILTHPELKSNESIATHWAAMYGVSSNDLSMRSRFTKAVSEPVISRLRGFCGG